MHDTNVPFAWSIEICIYVYFKKGPRNVYSFWLKESIPPWPKLNVRCWLLLLSLYFVAKIVSLKVVWHQPRRLIIYTMQNELSNCFCMCQIHHIRLSLPLYCIKIQALITRERIPGENVKNDISKRLYQRGVSFYDIKDIFYHIRKLKP